jgi:ribosome-associated protein
MTTSLDTLPVATASDKKTAPKRSVQKLQRAVVDGLEDVKGQDIVVFDTEHLSPLFERVIVASGTSNRQTKALAASVVDAVREAGFPKPRIEGEDNGEWIIVDCGHVVAHVMQPAIRTYYHLEELWGEKPVRLKLGAAKPVAPAPVAAPVAKKASLSLRRSSAAKKGQELAADAESPKQKRRVARVDTAQEASESAAPSRRPSRGPRAQAAAAGPTPAKRPAAKRAPRKVATVVVGAPKKKPAAKSAASIAAGKVPGRRAAPRA